MRPVADLILGAQAAVMWNVSAAGSAFWTVVAGIVALFGFDVTSLATLAGSLGAQSSQSVRQQFPVAVTVVPAMSSWPYMTPSLTPPHSCASRLSFFAVHRLPSRESALGALISVIMGVRLMWLIFVKSRAGRGGALPPKSGGGAAPQAPA